MKRILELYFSGPRSRSLGILACLLVAGFLEGIGMAAMIPLVTLVVGGTEAGGFGAEVLAKLASWGLQPSLGQVLLFVAITLVTKSVLQAAAMIYVGFSSAELVTELRRKIVSTMLEARWGFLLRQKTGRLSNVLNSESNRAGDLYVQIGMLLATVIQTLTYLVVSIAVSWKLALGGLAIGATLGYGVRSLVSYARRNAGRSLEVQRKLLSLFIEAIRNAKPLKAMGREESFSKSLNKSIDKYRKLQRKAALNREALANIQDAAAAVVLCAAFYPLFTYRVASAPELVVSALLLARILSMMGKIQKAYHRVLMLESAYSTTLELIDESARAREVSTGSDPAHFERSIRFENVELRHGEHVALEEIDLEIPAGRCTVLLGPSGAGKTSIVDLVLGLYRPTRGRITVDGQPLDELDMQSWRESVGYVPQENVLLHDTIRANVTLGDARIGEADIAHAIELAGAADFVAAQPKGLDTTVGETGGKLSGGERQRIALARALARRPRLLILDEVTSALDPETATGVAEQIGKLVGETTVLAITHRPEFLDVADTVYRIEKGRVTDHTQAHDARSSAAS
jgi:ATP-binding cassette subfamily C protein